MSFSWAELTVVSLVRRLWLCLMRNIRVSARDRSTETKIRACVHSVNLETDDSTYVPMEISIILLGTAQSSVPQTWIIAAGLVTGQSLGSLVLEQPSQSFEEKEVIWYIEEFALKDPYSKSRARVVARHLDDYATRLARQLRPAVSKALKLTKAGDDRLSLRLHIQACENTVNIHSIKWELLERQAACVELWNSKSILVIRRVLPVLPAPAPSLQQSKLNILYLTARHTFKDAIPYRIISLPVWEIAKTARKQGLDVHLYFVRPGTWQSLNATLEGHAKGFFSVAHFDLHGVLLPDQRSESPARSHS
jgi:hypothetical protein